MWKWNGDGVHPEIGMDDTLSTLNGNGELEAGSSSQRSLVWILSVLLFTRDMYREQHIYCLCENVNFAISTHASVTTCEMWKMGKFAFSNMY